MSHIHSQSPLTMQDHTGLHSGADRTRGTGGGRLCGNRRVSASWSLKEDVIGLLEKFHTLAGK